MTQSNIEFNSVKTAHGTELSSGPIGILNQVGVDEEFGGVINAVDIDWNEAQLNINTVIRTTGDLINAIKNASETCKTTAVGPVGPSDNVTLNFSSTNQFIVPQVSQDAKGQLAITSRTITLPSNPNSDTKVTSVDNHYKTNGLSGSNSEKAMHKIAYDAAGHIISTSPVTANDISNLVNLNTVNWNSTVQFGNLATGEPTSINSLDDLMTLINDMHEEIYVLSAAVVALGSAIQD